MELDPGWCGGFVLDFVGGPLDGQRMDVGHRAAWPIWSRGGLYERRETPTGWAMVWREDPELR